MLAALFMEAGLLDQDIGESEISSQSELRSREIPIAIWLHEAKIVAPYCRTLPILIFEKGMPKNERLPEFKKRWSKSLTQSTETSVGYLEISQEM